jgi:hypothetical protein
MLNVQQQAKSLTQKGARNHFGTSGQKPAGTRLGIQIDWREGSLNSGRQSGCYGRSLRDGK